MTATKSFKDFNVCLAKRLVPAGFAADRDILWCKVRDTVIVLEVQKDQKHSTKEEVRFTINIGVSIDVLRAGAAADGGGHSMEILRPEKCHWRARLGRLLQAPSDVWWSVHDVQTAQSTCDEIAAAVLDVALPKVEAVASSEVLIRLWQEGQGQGLTEYERRVSLAKLLIALGRQAEAQEAVQALEKSSLGKSWERSASYDVQELSKRLAAF
jgi:hypothetical protein